MQNLSIERQTVEKVGNSIYLIRGQRIMVDHDLAELYNVSTKRLNEQVRRNKARFPFDFMFQLTQEETTNLRSQFATSSLDGHGGRRYYPFVFTEYGAVMVASVLNSQYAIDMSILVVRAFIRLRNILSTHVELAHKISDIERQFKDKTKEHAMHINKIYKILDALMVEPTSPAKVKIGFNTREKKE